MIKKQDVVRVALTKGCVILGPQLVEKSRLNPCGLGRINSCGLVRAFSEMLWRESCFLRFVVGSPCIEATGCKTSTLSDKADATPGMCRQGRESFPVK
jgi:hypothetical protein